MGFASCARTSAEAEAFIACPVGRWKTQHLWGDAVKYCGRYRRPPKKCATFGVLSRTRPVFLNLDSSQEAPR